ncbi:MAG: hypothetical protein JWP43_1064 [Ramlibacter sp.]|jgi:hypothetical protein|nr:hypothetical protein [Ramlibacter sp.]
MNRIKQHSLFMAVAAACSFANTAGAATEDEVRSAFEKFVQVQNAHDAKGLESLLADSGQVLWITRGTAIWGREAVLQRFSQLYQGTWKLEPEWSAFRVVPLGADTAQLVVPVQFTTGASGQTPSVARMFLNQTLMKTSSGWRVVSILPIAAAAP